MCASVCLYACVCVCVWHAKEWGCLSAQSNPCLPSRASLLQAPGTQGPGDTASSHIASTPSPTFSCRRQELKALVTLHAEPQDDGSVSALTADEVQVIQVRARAGVVWVIVVRVRVRQPRAAPRLREGW